MGLDLCVPHHCHCGSLVDARGLHSFVCKRAPSRSARHHALNDLIARSFAAAGIPVTKEPTGLFRSDGKRPEGLTLVPWQNGKSLCWDVTVICPLADSYVSGAAHEAGATVEVAATRNGVKTLNMQALQAAVCLSPLLLRHWARSILQLASS